jgi:hypothetical protein
VAFAKIGNTQFVRTAHPTMVGSAAPPKEYWIEFGRRIRSTTNR